MLVKTIKVSNVSTKASEGELKEFFSFSGDIDYVEIKSENEDLNAYITFKDSKGAETAVLLTGATIADKTVRITLDPDYELPPAVLAQIAGSDNPALQKAEYVVSSMLAKGFILGKDALKKAKSFDEKHQLTSTASFKIASLNQKIGFTEKVSMGTSAVNTKVKEMDQKYQVSEKTKNAYSIAEEKVSSAGSAIMKNRYVLLSVAWVTGAFNKVTKKAGEVGQKTKEKVDMVEKNEHKRKVADDFSRDNLSENDSPNSSPPMSSPPSYSEIEQQSGKPEPVKGLVI